MSRQELESLGMTDAQLVAEAKRLFGIEPNILVDEDTKDVQRARRYAFDLVTEKWRVGKTHVIASTPCEASRSLVMHRSICPDLGPRSIS